MVNDGAHARNMAFDAGYGAAASRETTPFEHIHDPALGYVAHLMVEGDEDMLLAFAQGMRDRFHDEGLELSARQAADLMTRSAWVDGCLVTDTGYMPTGWSDDRKAALSAELRALIESRNFVY